MTREEKILDREKWLVAQLVRIKNEAIQQMMPFTRELGEIRDSQPPDPFAAPDGTTWHYAGPLPPYLLPEERNTPAETRDPARRFTIMSEEEYWKE